MADRDRWYDERSRAAPWRGEDRPDDTDREAQRGYRGYSDGRTWGAAGYEGERREPGRSGFGHERDPRGAWPAYDPGRDSPDVRDRSGVHWRGEAGPSGRGRDSRADHEQNRPLWGRRHEPRREERSPWFGDDPDRREPEGRSFWDKAREEAAHLFGQGEHRGHGPRGYRRSDQRIHEDVNDRLTDDPYLDASDMEVHVRDGEVALDGHVRSREDKRRAEDLAERVSGVRHVRNNLHFVERHPDAQESWTTDPTYPLP